MDNNNSSKRNFNYPHFLSNSPCNEDLFEGKSHSKIAGNIADLLIENQNSNIIGIEGTWGSGKSNLIKLVEKNIIDEKQKKEFHFFIYDAWGYQNDNQIRSIIEILAKDLNKNKFITGFKEKLSTKELFSKKNSVESKNLKKLNAFSIGFSVFALLETISTCFSSDIKYKIFSFVCGAFTTVILQVINVKTLKDSVRFSDLFISYFDSKNHTNNLEYASKQEIIYTEVPSTRDFQNWINDIDVSLNKNKLVIIFDNMDRVPAQRVQELWAAITCIFSNSEKPLKNISVLIPFDREHIKNAFKNENIIETSETESYGDDFINKTFNVVYRVSAPIMSDWKKYFTLKWKEAFNEEPDFSIIQIYDLLNTENNTPRTIIAFINNFVSIRKIFSKSEIPDKYAALFIFGKSKIDDDINEILEPNYLKALDFLYKNDKELPKYISALYYQLKPEVALDLVYTQQIVSALNNNKLEDLARLTKLSTSEVILQNAIANVTNIANATLGLEKVFFNLKLKEETEQFLWDCLYKKNTNKETVLQGYQLVLLKHINKKDSDEYLTNILSDFANAKDFNIADYFKSLKKLKNEKIKDFEAKEYFQEKTVAPEEYIEFIELAKDGYEEYKIKCDYEELDNYLKDLPNEKLENMTAMKYLKIDNKDKKFSEYFNSLDSKIATSPTDKNVIPFLYERLKEIQRPIKNLPKDQTIGTLFSTTKPEENFYTDVVCMRLAKLNIFFLQNNPPLFTSVLSKTDEDFVRKIAEKINCYINFDDLLIKADKMKACPLYIAVCKEVIKNEDLGVQRASIFELLKNYSKIKATLQLEPSAILKSFDRWNEFIKDYVTINNVSEIPIEYFEDAKEIDDENYQHCSLITKEYLNTKTVEEWESSIISSGNDFKLLIIINGKSDNCFEAFKSVMIKQATNENTNLKKENCTKLMQLALKNKRKLKTLFNDIRDAFCSGNTAMNLPKFNFFGEWLFEYSDLGSKKEALRTILPTTILDNDTVVNVLIKNSGTIKSMVDNSGEEASDFLNKIKSLCDDKYSKNERFIDFAKKIGLKKKNAEEKE